MSAAQFVVGIDLGTTHCALAYANLATGKLYLLPILQMLAPGETSEHTLLPSFLYLPAPSELTPEESNLLPSLPKREGQYGDKYVVGQWARKRGASAPGRMVASAKSWVCHGRVNRRAAILPWGTPDSEPHISPFSAQVAYLEHLKQVWDKKYPEAPLHEQDVVVTVPASFDEGARTLTHEAAATAGLGKVRLLEEPQAAFYDYLGSQAEPEAARALKEQLHSSKVILVVDIGGGTTDLTLLRVLPADACEGTSLPSTSPEETTLPLIERIAVGGHLMLGGDNMDAALATFALEKANLPRPEDPSIWSGLMQSARNVKELLLSKNAPAQGTISYQGRSSRLVGNTKSILLTRDETLKVLLNGFFPLTAPAEIAQKEKRAGLTTLGLPYASDTAVSRHICAFLRRHAPAAKIAGADVVEGLPQVDLLLLNGGVFHSPSLTARLDEVLASWYPGASPTRLSHTSLDTSVARGAVRSALARHGVGQVIQGGSAHAYYIGIEQAGKMQALCLAPKNTEESTRLVVPDRLFELRLNQRVSFPLFTYCGDRVDAPGQLVEIDSDQDALTVLPPLQTILRAPSSDSTSEKSSRNLLSVTLESSLDETGRLQISLVSLELPPRRWNLDFVLRAQSNVPSPQKVTPSKRTNKSKLGADEFVLLPPDEKTPGALRLLRAAFLSADDEGVRAIRRDLEETLGPRGAWSASTCRALFDGCLKLVNTRSTSAPHELNWLRLSSWCLRPGFGCPGDDKRMEALWSLFDEGPCFSTKTHCAEWWILWRRVAGGLTPAAQRSLFDLAADSLWTPAKKKEGNKKSAAAPTEMMRLLASLEQLPASLKTQCGELFLQRAHKLGTYWPLGRVGARVLFQQEGDHTMIVSAKIASQWLQALLSLDWSSHEGVAFAATSIAQLTGDRTLDIGAELRETVAARLEKEGSPTPWREMVLQSKSLERSDLKRLLGDSLPAGLRLK